MNKKAQVGPIGAIMLFMVFLVIYFIWGASWVSQVGADAVVSANLTGLEAFFFENLNLTIIICMLLGMMGWMYFGGGNQ